ncbi:MAG: RNA-directed DNA polymerase, partial [Candidatus Woesebacteria bacterium]|nr:RNA-directed DNA polymerase [Candidatus Woesebacteria bacterium]
RGLPIGNLTSQLFANIYLNELDQFIKHKLKIKNYLRYTDDFVVVGGSKKYLEGLVVLVSDYLCTRLKLTLHPDKVDIRKYSQGIDFLGYVILPYHKVVRTKTKRRIVRRLNKENLASYLGVLSHANSFELEKSLRKLLLKDI